jgi:LuxR family maltose regulon positive regulatory protein
METWETSRAIGNIYIDIIASMKYAITLRQQGKLGTVKEICQQQLVLANESGLSASAEAGWILAIWGEVLSEQGDLIEGKEKAGQGKKQAQGGDIAILSWCNLCLIKALFSCEDYAGAEAIIKEIEDQGLHQLPPWIRNRIFAWKLRIWLVQDRVEKASQWLMERGLDTAWEPGTLQDLDYRSLARVHIAEGNLFDALDILERISNASQGRGNTSLTIEALNLQALALHAAGDTDEAMNFLEQALALAEPGGFLRVFVDEGPPMARLLYEALSREISAGNVRKILAAFPVVEPEPHLFSPPGVSDDEWIEPLTERELEVLQLIAEGLSRQEIGVQLVLSLNTVKTHARNIFSKLGVNNQMQAVGKARGLGLLNKD